MGKLIFINGTMAAGKTATLVQKAYQFTESGQEVVVLKPSIDTRSNKGVVSSRIGIEWPATTVAPGDSIKFNVKLFPLEHLDIILVDEVNFFTADQVEELARLADEEDILVIAFGLLTDFEGKLFDASKRLIELADRVDHLPSMCQTKGCGKKATHHIRTTKDSAQFVVGDSIYKSVCRKCFNSFNKEQL